MSVTWLLAAATLSIGLLACSQPKSEDAPKPAVAVAPAAHVDARDAAIDTRQAVAVVPAPVAPAGPPRKHVKAGGVELTETSDGRVILKTTATWGEPIDTTYSDCSYYVAALPVLRTQVSALRAKLLDRVCTKAALP